MATIPAVKQFSDRMGRIEVSATMAVVAEAAKLKAAGADMVEFGAGEPHFPTPQHIKDAAIDAIQKNFTKYTPVPGILELRTAIAKWSFCLCHTGFGSRKSKNARAESASTSGRVKPTDSG